VPEVGQHFTLKQWTGAAAAGGEVRLDPDRLATGRQLVNARSTMAGRTVGWLRDKAGCCGEGVSAKQARKEAVAELRGFLGNFADGAFAAAGIQKGKPLQASQVRVALAFLAEKGRDLDGMVGRPDTCMHNTRIRHLEGELARVDRRIQSARDAGRDPAADTVKSGDRMRGELALLKSVTVQAHVDRVIARYDRTKGEGADDGRDRAMHAAIKLRAVSHQIATDKFNFPRTRPAVCDLLCKAHAKDLAPADSTERKLTQQLARSDTLMKVLLGRLDPGGAAAQVRDMAAAVGIEPASMLDAMKQLLACELESHGRREIDVAEHASDKPEFSFTEVRLLGEIPPSLFKPAGGTDPDERAQLSDAALAKLAEVEAALGRAQPAAPDVDARLVGIRGVTDRQNAFLQGVRRTEAAMIDVEVPGEGGSPRQQVLAHLASRYGITEEQAATVLAKAEEWFATAPLTITFKAADIFTGATPAHGTKYKAAQELRIREFNAAEMSEALGGKGTDESLSTPVSAETGRGQNYLRWRAEKDDIETRLSGLGATEQATFGAVNINFGKTGGFEGDASAYGESHLLLKPEVRERAVFNFNKTREPRAGATMIMYDMLHNRNGDDKGTPVDKKGFIDAVVHNALGLDGIVHTNNLQLEVQIFGEVDMVKDVAAAHIPAAGFEVHKGFGTLDDPARTNATSFFNDKGIAVREWVKPAHEKIPEGSAKLAGLVAGALELRAQQNPV
jgi:hypothetical protein